MHPEISRLLYNLRRPYRRAVWMHVLAKRPEVTVAFAGGLRLASPTGNVSVRNTYVKGTKDPHVFRWLDRFLRSGMNVLDVGANVGAYTLAIARSVGPQGLVVAVEPDEVNVAYLRRNVEANRLTNVRIEAVAAGAECGSIGFVRSDSNCGGHRVGLGSDCSVPLVTLDALVATHRLPSVDFVKMDIEGFEHEALRGLRAMLDAHDPVLLVEHGEDRLATAAMLEAAHFRPHVLRKGRMSACRAEEVVGDTFWSRHPLT
jgi:FkbM family methyltransferase